MPVRRRAASLRELLTVVDDPLAVTQLREYFGTGVTDGGLPRFTGGRFEALAGGGDRAGAADAITADDLLAVQMLSVRVPAPVVLDLLEGALGRQVGAVLGQIPTGVDLGTPPAGPLLAADGPAQKAWDLLKGQPGVEWVIAGKVLARKRPRLVPVYDAVVRCALGSPRQAWSWLDARFAEQDRALPGALSAARQEAGVGRAVSLPRVLDVIL